MHVSSHMTRVIFVPFWSKLWKQILANIIQHHSARKCVRW